MNTMLDATKPFDLCTSISIESDPIRRTAAIAHMRGDIAKEQEAPHSPEDQTCLRIAEMILDFLEEDFDPRSRDLLSGVPL